MDAEDAFDPASAAAAGVRLDRLLWVRCGHNAEHALKAADLLIQGGGFGVVALDLGDTPPATARRISLTSWFRLRRAVEHTPTVLMAVARQSNAKTCASLMLECARRRRADGPGAPRIPRGCCGGIRVGGARTATAAERRHVRLSSWQRQSDGAGLRVFAGWWSGPRPIPCTLDASGLDRLFGLPQDVAAAIARRAAELGLQANLALAANPDAAICAARGFPGVSIIPQGDEAKFLGPLPLALLAPSPELRETLERWGIRRFQDLAALPPLGIAERLGPEGSATCASWRAARRERKLLPLEEPARFEDEIELEYPVELLEPLAFLLARLVNGLATRLATRALATDELRLRLKLENRAAHERTLRLPVAVARYQGVSETAAARSGRASARRRPSCTSGWR